MNFAIKLPQTDAYDSRIEETGLKVNRYDKRYRQYWLVAQQGMSDHTKHELTSLFREAYQRYMG